MSQHFRQILLSLQSSCLGTVKHDFNLRRPVLSNLFMGIGIYHSIYNEQSYSQTVLSCLFPTPYIGYHLYKNFDKIENKINKIIYKNISIGASRS